MLSAVCEPPEATLGRDASTYILQCFLKFMLLGVAGDLSFGQYVCMGFAGDPLFDLCFSVGAAGDQFSATQRSCIVGDVAMPPVARGPVNSARTVGNPDSRDVAARTVGNPDEGGQAERQENNRKPFEAAVAARGAGRWRLARRAS